MTKNSSSWTKFEPLTTAIFLIYNISSLDIIKFVAFFINLNSSVMFSHTQKQKVTQPFPANTLRKSNVIIQLFFGNLRKLLSANLACT